MQSHRQFWVLAAAGGCVFAVSVLILLRLMPPRRDIDYLVTGAFSTMLALGAVFATLQLTTMKSANPFGKVRRRKNDQTSDMGR